MNQAVQAMTDKFVSAVAAGRVPKQVVNSMLGYGERRDARCCHQGPQQTRHRPGDESGHLDCNDCAGRRVQHQTNLTTPIIRAFDDAGGG